MSTTDSRYPAAKHYPKSNSVDIQKNIIETKLRDVSDMFFDGWKFREILRKLVAKINKQKKLSKKVLPKFRIRRIMGIDRTINSSYDMKY